MIDLARLKAAYRASPRRASPRVEAFAARVANRLFGRASGAPARALEAKLLGGFAVPAAADLAAMAAAPQTHPRRAAEADWALARWRADRGDPAAALDALAAMRERLPGAHAAQSRLVEADCLIRLGRTAEARALLDPHVATDPEAALLRAAAEDAASPEGAAARLALVAAAFGLPGLAPADPALPPVARQPRRRRPGGPGPALGDRPGARRALGARARPARGSRRPDPAGRPLRGPPRQQRRAGAPAPPGPAAGRRLRAARPRLPGARVLRRAQLRRGAGARGAAGVHRRRLRPRAGLARRPRRRGGGAAGAAAGRPGAHDRRRDPSRAPGPTPSPPTTGCAASRRSATSGSATPRPPTSRSPPRSSPPGAASTRPASPAATPPSAAPPAGPAPASRSSPTRRSATRSAPTGRRSSSRPAGSRAARSAADRADRARSGSSAA